MQTRRKAPVFEFVRYNGVDDYEVINFVKGDWVHPLDGAVHLDNYGDLSIKTLDGMTKISKDDYIVKNPDGNFSVKKTIKG